MFDRRMTNEKIAVLGELVHTLIYDSPLQVKIGRLLIGPDCYQNHWLKTIKFRVLYSREKERRRLIMYLLTISSNRVDFFLNLGAMSERLSEMSSPFHKAEDIKTAKDICSLLLTSMLMQSCASSAWKGERYEDAYRVANELLHLQQQTGDAKEIFETVIDAMNFLKGTIYTHWCPERLSMCQDYSNDGGRFNDVMTSDLVLTSVLYKQKLYDHVNNMLDEIEACDTEDVIPLCTCTDVLERTGIGRVQVDDFYTNGKFKHIAPCVIFTPFDIPIMLEPLHLELLRLTGSTISASTIDYLYDFWFHWAVVDARIYQYFLRYRLCRDSSDFVNKKKAFTKLKQLARKAEVFVDQGVDQGFMKPSNLTCCLGHIETAWNLIGWIYVQEKMLDAAVRCFTRSWQRRRNHNAAKWHLAMLLFDHLM